MENISYGKIVLIGAGHVGSAILDSLLRQPCSIRVRHIYVSEEFILNIPSSHSGLFHLRFSLYPLLFLLSDMDSQ